MDIKIEGKTRIKPEDVPSYYKKEIQRVEEAIEDAKKKMMDLRKSIVMTGEKAGKISELNYAIAFGKIYLAKLKTKANGHT